MTRSARIIVFANIVGWAANFEFDEAFWGYIKAPVEFKTRFNTYFNTSPNMIFASLRSSQTACSAVPTPAPALPTFT